MVFWEIIRWLVGERKKAEQAARYMSPEEAEQYVFKETLRKLNERLALEAKEALKTIREAAQKEEDYKLKKLLDEIAHKTEYELDKDDPFDMMPEHLTLALATAEAIKRGIHRDPDRLTRYLLKHQYEVALKIFKEIPYIPPCSEDILHCSSMSHFLGTVEKVLGLARLKEQKKLAETLYNKAVEDRDIWVKYPDLAHEKFTSYVKRELGLDWWDLSPEEILESEIKSVDKRKVVGVKGSVSEIVWFDRFPVSVSEFLVYSIVFGELLRDYKWVDKKLYLVFEELASSPMFMSNWVPWLEAWFERLEREEKVGPFKYFLENMPLDPDLKFSMYGYISLFEQGRNLNSMSMSDKEMFDFLLIRIADNVFMNSKKYLGFGERILLCSKSIDRSVVSKTLYGLIHDFAQIYSGRKKAEELCLERDMGKVYYIIRNLRDHGSSLDLLKVEKKLREIIDRNIENPLTRRAYLQTLDYYTQTIQDLPRSKDFVQVLLDMENKLKELLLKTYLSEKETIRYRKLYRILVLTTIDSTIEGLQRFYSKLKPMFTIKASRESFLPVHGSIAAETLLMYNNIVNAGKDYAKVLKREIAYFESLFFAEPYIEKYIAKTLRSSSDKILWNQHEEFIDSIAKLQIRQPITM